MNHHLRWISTPGRVRLTGLLLLMLAGLLACNGTTSQPSMPKTWDRLRSGAWNTVEWELFGHSRSDGDLCLGVVLRPRPDPLVIAGSPNGQTPDFAYAGCGPAPRADRSFSQPVVMLMQEQDPKLDYHLLGATVAPQLSSFVAYYSDGSSEIVQAEDGHLLVLFSADKRMTTLTTPDGRVRCDIRATGSDLYTMSCPSGQPQQ